MRGGEAPRAAEAHTPTPLPGCSLGVLRLQFSWAKPIPRCPHLATARKLAVLQRHGGGGGGGGGAAPMPPNQCSRLAAAREFAPAPPKHMPMAPVLLLAKKHRSTAWAQPPRRRSTYSDAPAQPPFLSCEPALTLYSVMLPSPKNKMYMKSAKKYHAPENNLFWKCTRTLPNRTQA